MRILVLLVLAAYGGYASAGVTADQLRDMADQGERDAVQRSQRVNTGSVGALLKGGEPRITKYDAASPIAPVDSTPAPKPSRAARRSAPAVAAPEAAAVPVATPASANIYIPPARAVAGAGDQIVSDAVKPAANFGIRLGSWLNAELRRNTTSAEMGTIELTITTTYPGDRRSLPEGTLVFADKTLNPTTKRMEMVVTHGITPDGREFDMRGLVFDPQKIPGLAGIFVMNKKEVVASGVTKGAIAAVGAAVSQVAGVATPVGAAAGNAASQSVLNDTAQAADFNHSQQAVIYVSPQPLLIRVEKQF